MPFLPSSGQISIGTLNGFFPGSGTAMSNFYRGGGRVPATKTVPTSTREPASGDVYNSSNFWQLIGNGQVYIRWAGVNVQWGARLGVNATSWTSGNITYYRGSLRVPFAPKTNYADYAVFRIISGSTTVSINTGIPSSGQISLSQFYGAEVP